MTSEISTVKKPAKRKPKKISDVSMPKDKFDKVMELLNDKGECEEYFQRKCSVQVQNITATNRNSFRNTMHKLLEEARFCVMQRDWKNLAKILTLAKPCRKNHIIFYQVFVRYAVICLAHNPDENLMELFLAGVVGCSNEAEKTKFLRSLTNN